MPGGPRRCLVRPLSLGQSRGARTSDTRFRQQRTAGELQDRPCARLDITLDTGGGWREGTDGRNRSDGRHGPDRTYGTDRGPGTHRPGGPLRRAGPDLGLWGGEAHCWRKRRTAPTDHCGQRSNRPHHDGSAASVVGIAVTCDTTASISTTRPRRTWARTASTAKPSLRSSTSPGARGRVNRAGLPVTVAGL